STHQPACSICSFCPCRSTRCSTARSPGSRVPAPPTQTRHQAEPPFSAENVKHDRASAATRQYASALIGLLPTVVRPTADAPPAQSAEPRAFHVCRSTFVLEGIAA